MFGIPVWVWIGVFLVSFLGWVIVRGGSQKLAPRPKGFYEDADGATSEVGSQPSASHRAQDREFTTRARTL